MNFNKVKEALDATEAAMMLGGIEPRDCEVFENGLGALEYLRSFIAELEKPAEEELYKNLYQAARSCILNKYPYEDESGIIKIQLGNYAKLKSAYDEINKKIKSEPSRA